MLDNTKDCQNREFDIYEAACGGVLSSGRALTGSLAWPLPVYPGTGTRGQSSLPLDFPFFYRGVALWLWRWRWRWPHSCARMSLCSGAQLLCIDPCCMLMHWPGMWCYFISEAEETRCAPCASVPRPQAISPLSQPSLSAPSRLGRHSPLGRVICSHPDALFPDSTFEWERRWGGELA